MAKTFSKHVIVAALVAGMSTSMLAVSPRAAVAVEPEPTPISGLLVANESNNAGDAPGPQSGIYHGPIITTSAESYRFPLSQEPDEWKDIDLLIDDPNPFETIQVVAYGLPGVKLEQDLDEKKWELKIPVNAVIAPTSVEIHAFGPQEFTTSKRLTVEVYDPANTLPPVDPANPNPEPGPGPNQPPLPGVPSPTPPDPEDPVGPVPPEPTEPSDPTPKEPESPTPDPAPNPELPLPPVDTPNPPAPEVPEPAQNRAPVISVKDQTFTVGRYNYFDVTVADADGDAIRDFQATALSGAQVYNLTPNTWRVTLASWMPVGEYTMWFHAQDARGADTSAKVKIAITQPAPPPNQGPSVWIAKEATFFNNVQNRLPFRVVDPDGDTIHHVNFSSHSHISTEFRGGDRFDLVFAPGIAPGVYKVTLNGVDWKGKVGPNVVVTVTIKAPSVNYGPQVHITNAAFDNGVQRRVRFTVTDREGDAISNVWWNPYPGWTLAHVSGNTWEVRIPAGYRAGTYRLTLWATDARGATGPASSAYVSLSQYVPPAPTNRAPVISGGNFYIHRGRTTYHQIGAYDPDGDPIYLRLREAPPWVSFGYNTLGFRAPLWERGTHRIVIEATDGKATSYGVYNVTVISRWGYR